MGFILTTWEFLQWVYDTVSEYVIASGALDGVLLFMDWVEWWTDAELVPTWFTLTITIFLTMLLWGWMWRLVRLLGSIVQMIGSAIEALPFIGWLG